MVVAAVALVILVGVVGLVTTLVFGRSAAGGQTSPSTGPQVLTSQYVEATSTSHTCTTRSVLVTWTLGGAKAGTLATLRATGTGPTQQFNATVDPNGKTVRVSMSFQTPSKWNVEIISVGGKPVHPPASNPAGAITLAC